MALSSELLKILTCPVTGDKLLYDREGKELISLKAALAYPIRDNIPILLVDEARRIQPSQYRYLDEEKAPAVGFGREARTVSEVA